MLFQLAATFNVEELSLFDVALALVAPRCYVASLGFLLTCRLIKQSLQQEVSSRLWPS